MTTNKQDIKTEELAKICRAIPQEVAVDELEGVTSLSVLRDLPQRFGLHQAIRNSDGMMGRGFRVQALARPMYEWLHKEFKGGDHE